MDDIIPILLFVAAMVCIPLGIILVLAPLGVLWELCSAIVFRITKKEGFAPLKWLLYSLIAGAILAAVLWIWGTDGLDKHEGPKFYAVLYFGLATVTPVAGLLIWAPFAGIGWAVGNLITAIRGEA